MVTVGGVSGCVRFRKVITVQQLKNDDAGTWRAFICGPEPFQSETRKVRPGAYRFASAGFPLCPPPLPIPYGTRRKAACLPQTKSGTFPGALPLFLIPEQFFPVAEGNLQISPN